MERFVYIEPEGLLHDLRQKAPGRGAWVHPRQDCLSKALSGGGFSRAMKRKVDIGDVDDQIQEVAQAIRHRQTEALRDAIRAGEVIVGQMLVQEAVKKDELKLLVLADDAGESTRRKFLSNAERKGLRVICPWSGSQLGQMTGREFVSIIGIATTVHVSRVLRDEERWLALAGDDG